jgi:hypothetical protein
LAGVSAFLLTRDGSVGDRDSQPDELPIDSHSNAATASAAPHFDHLEATQSAFNRESAIVASPSPSLNSAETEGERLEDGPELWQALYADATLGQVIDERKALFSGLNEATEKAYEEMWSRGRFDYAPLDEDEDGGLKIPTESFKSGELSSIKIDAGAGLVRWVTLPREEFAEQYKTRDRIAWLMEREAELRRSGR